MLGDYLFSVLAAGLVSLQLAALALLLALALGLAGAFCKRSRSRALRLLAGLYTTLVRGVPDLVLMLLVYYSLPALLNQGFDALGWDYSVEFSPFAAGCATLGLIFGAYMTETFRAALAGIPAASSKPPRHMG